MEFKTENVENGTRIRIQGEDKAAVVIRDDGEERILLPVKHGYSETTYYYEDPSGLSETENGYIGFYPGNPDHIKLLS
jgi:hypothetical protein